MTAVRLLDVVYLLWSTMNVVQLRTVVNTHRQHTERNRYHSHQPIIRLGKYSRQSVHRSVDSLICKAYLHARLSDAGSRHASYVQWLKWFCEAGGHRFNQGAHTTAGGGGSNGSRVAGPPGPLTLTTAYVVVRL